MDIIIIMLMAIASFFISMYLEKITKLPNVIYLMILGVILGSDVTDLVSYLPSISKYSTLAIVLLFLVSGYGLSMKGFGVKPRKTTVLASLPFIKCDIDSNFDQKMMRTILDLYQSTL